MSGTRTFTSAGCLVALGMIFPGRRGISGVLSQDHSVIQLAYLTAVALQSVSKSEVTSSNGGPSEFAFQP